jgi:glutathione synthase/RimK-type ligase-like ATP-grasp enzyme
MRIAFCTNIPPLADPSSLRGRNHAIVARLEDAGHEVEVLYRPEQLLAAGGPPRYDAGMLCPNDLFEAVPDPSGRRDADTVATAIEHAGVPFVNSPLRRRVSTNKLLAHLALGWAGLPRPDAWTLRQLDEIDWPPEGIIVKPVTGSGGVGVALARSRGEAATHAAALGEPCFLQRFVPDARCIRVVATRQASVGRYEKRVARGTIVAGIGSGAQEVKLAPREDLDELAIAVTRAVGMDVAGIDVLETPAGALLALEVNVNFGFYPRNGEILDAIAAQVRAVAAPGRAAA